MSDPLNYIGIARKAGSIQLGETNSGAAVRCGKAKLLVLASDASVNARKRAENFVYGRNTALLTLPYTKEELCSITGAHGCSMAAFTDIGLAAAFLKKLAETDSAFLEASEKLTAQNEKAMQRKKEAQAHSKNKKFGRSARNEAPEKRRKQK